MAVQLTPPKKQNFHVAVVLGAVAILLYLLGVFGAFEGGWEAISHYAFWLAVGGWAVLLAAVVWKGV
jgi:hypothetical protein